MKVLPISEVITESKIVVFSPHFDDFLFFLGGYVWELRERDMLPTKQFHILNLFSRSNYLARTGSGNFDTSLDRLKKATGIRLLEDLNCLDELLGEYSYRYELCGEKECLARGKTFADSEMEFPHGMYEDFNEQDHAIFNRMVARIKGWALEKDTALIFPLAFKEHIDHFITREAAVQVAKALGDHAKATFYFQEDKPYSGIATEAEIERIEEFVRTHSLQLKLYRHHPEKVIELAFKHYVSQVEEVYKSGIRNRCDQLKKQYLTEIDCDRLYVWSNK